MCTVVGVIYENDMCAVVGMILWILHEANRLCVSLLVR